MASGRSAAPPPAQNRRPANSAEGVTHRAAPGISGPGVHASILLRFFPGTLTAGCPPALAEPLQLSPVLPGHLCHLVLLFPLWFPLQGFLHSPSTDLLSAHHRPCVQHGVHSCEGQSQTGKWRHSGAGACKGPSAGSRHPQSGTPPPELGPQWPSRGGATPFCLTSRRGPKDEGAV